MSDQSLVEQAAALTQSVTALDSTVKSMRVSQRRMKAVIAALVLAFVCLAGVGVVAWRASDRASSATDLAERNRDVQRLTCETGNQSREAQRQLWAYIFAAAAENDPDRTPEQQRVIDEFERYVAAVFAPRDCNNPAPPTSIPTPSR